jgi:hypothetical protein
MDKSKPASSGSCSDDLAQARAASRRLRGEGGGSNVASSGFVTFTSAPTPPPAKPPVPKPSVPLMTRRRPLNAPSAGFGPESWNTLLETCCAAVAADAAFLMDPAGLIISSREREADGLEAVGARLMVAFEQADRIDGQPTTLSLSIETPRGTLFGLRLAQPDAGFLTLGFSIPAGLTAERQARLVTIVGSAA